MGDAASADDRLPWLVPPRTARPVSAASRARTPLLLLLGLFCFSAIALLAYLAGRGLMPEAPDRAPPSIAAAPAPTPRAMPPPSAPPPVAMTAPPAVAPAPASAAPARPVRKRVTRKAVERRAAVRAAPAVRVHRTSRPVRAAPRRYRWPPNFAAAPSGRVVQLGAYPSGHQTMAAWQRLRRAYPHLATLPRKVVVSAPRPGRQRYYRLRFGTGSPGEARALCDALHRIGRGCIVV